MPLIHRLCRRGLFSGSGPTPVQLRLEQYLRAVCESSNFSRSSFGHRFCLRPLSTVYGLPSVPESVTRWNRAVLEAERVVGDQPSSYNVLSLLGRDGQFSGMLRKILASSHPVANEIKQLFYGDRLNFQVRTLITLLLSKSSGHSFSSQDYSLAKISGWISPRQRALADIAEMVHTAFSVHTGLLNLSGVLAEDPEAAGQLHLVNGLGVLGGDYVFAQACVGLGSLEDSTVLNRMAKGISEFVTGSFYGESDSQGNSLPDSKDPVALWEARTHLLAGSLLSRACESTLILAGQNEKVQEQGYYFGRYTGLALQMNDELQPFVNLERHPVGTAFNVNSGPVVFHLENNPELLKYIREDGKKGVRSLDFKKIHEEVTSGNSVQKAQYLLDLCISKAEERLDAFDKSKSSEVLAEMIRALKV